LVDGDEVNLTPTEFAILKLLMESPGKVFSIKTIYKRITGYSSMGNENSVAVHIRHIREKIEITPSEPRYIKVVWGQGYKFEGSVK
jgi:DNA-binding response OmpR family regulator